MSLAELKKKAYFFLFSHIRFKCIFKPGKRRENTQTLNTMTCVLKVPRQNQESADLEPRLLLPLLNK